MFRMYKKGSILLKKKLKFIQHFSQIFTAGTEIGFMIATLEVEIWLKMCDYMSPTHSTPVLKY